MGKEEFSRNHQDADINPAAFALPNGAASTQSDGIELHDGSGFHTAAEFEIQAPAVDTADLPDTETLIYSVEESDDDSTYNLLYDSVVVQTGAGGVGAVADTQRFSVPGEVKQFIRVKATNSGAGDISDKNGTVVALF